MPLPLQYLVLLYYRVACPLHRLSVTLRHQGLAVAVRAVQERFAPVRPTAACDAPVLTPQPVERSASTPSGPLVSVVVRTYNRLHLLAQALDDLAAQTYRPLEVIVVNDGRASVEEVVARFSARLPVCLAPHRAGSGRSAALNSGVAHARGELITYLDDDDRAYPEHIATLAGGFRDGVDVIYTLAARVLCWSDGREDRPLESLPCVSREFGLDDLLVDNWIPLMTFMHRRASFDVAGPFDEALDLFEDWDFLIRLGQAHRFRHIPAVTCEYRYRFGPMEQQARSALSGRQRVLKSTERIYHRYPVTDAGLRARRELTLQALKRDIHEVAWIERTARDPLEADLRTAAWVGRFGRPERHAAALAALPRKAAG